MRSVGALVVAVVLCAGCSHPLLLKKYAATSPPVPALKGRAVFVTPYEDRRREEWSSGEPLPDPKHWEYREPTSAQLDQWDAERRKLGDNLPESQQYRVGQKRNGFGVPIKDVFSVNSPAQWLTDSTKLELAAQGATVADSADSADIVVQGVLRYAWLDLYMATWVHLVLDLTTTVRGQPPKSVRLHVADARLAWTGGDTESYEIFCSTEQKLQRYVLDEIARSAPQIGTTPPSL